MICAYVRASTAKQEDSPETQKDVIRAYIASHLESLGLVGKDAPEPLWFVDTETSRKVPIGEREAGGVLMRSLRRGDHLIVSKLDRSLGKLSDAIGTIEHLQRAGISLHVCNLFGGPADLSSPSGRLILHILASVSEWERETIAERTSDAIRALKRRGISCGKPHLGFKNELRTVIGDDGRKKRRKMEVPNPQERKVMKMILAWRMADPPWSYDQIRNKLSYELRVPTRSGRDWDNAMIWRYCRAEAVLQYQELAKGAGNAPRSR